MALGWSIGQAYLGARLQKDKHILEEGCGMLIPKDLSHCVCTIENTVGTVISVDNELCDTGSHETQVSTD